jgi:hemerythrin-like metal-binding protein
MIVWTEGLRVGHPDIDRDHQRLIGIINEFIEQAKNADNHRLMHETLKSLLMYTREHFKNEEKIQRECMYPYAKMHASEHENLIKQVEGMAKIYFIEKSQPIDNIAISRMKDLLNMWLIEHINKFDLNLRDWVVPAEST